MSASAGTIAANPVKGGLFIQPTIFTRYTNHMAIAEQELFGPVLVVIPLDQCPPHPQLGFKSRRVTPAN